MSAPLCLLQDSRGYLWVGTEDGLNRFDGLTFTVFRSDPDDPDSLGNNHVRALAEDSAGMLWIGTYGGGLDRFDPRSGHFTHYRHDPQIRSSLSDDQVLSLQHDREGSLWVGTRGGGLDRFDPATQEFTHFRHDPDDPGSLSHDVVGTIVEDEAGTLWVGTNAGLNRLERESGSFTRWLHDPQDRNSLAADPILALHSDPSGALWIGTSGGGLDLYRPAIDSFTHYPYSRTNPRGLGNPTVTALEVDPDGTVWVGTYDGLHYLDQAEGSFIQFRHNPVDPFSLSRNQIEALLLDRTGGLWVATYGGGLNRSDPQRARFALYQGDPDDPRSIEGLAIWAIYQDTSGVLWIGTDGAGLDRFDRSKGEWGHYRHDSADPRSLSSDVVMAIHEDHFRTLWVGTSGGGLGRMDRASGNFHWYRHDPEDPHSLSSDIVWFIREDRAGELWIGTANGLDHFDRHKERFTHYRHDPNNPHSLVDSNVGSFYEDRSGAIWVGTHDGLDRLDRNTGKFTHYRHDPEDPTSLSHNIVFAIHEDSRGDLWLGTWGGGLNRYNPQSGIFRRYQVADGLPNDVIYGILEDDQGCLWLSTNDGISRFDPRTESFTNYDVGDGLQSNEFSYNGYYKGLGGEMFFGGIHGFNAFHPEDAGGNPTMPPIVLTSLMVEGREFAPEFVVEFAEEIILPWPNTGFEFEYAALNFSQPEESQFAYRLEGFEQEWNQVGGKRFGRYTNLPGGEYTLWITGSSSEGVWNEPGISIKVHVVPPFWATWWFRGAAAALLALGAFGAYRLRVRSLEDRSRQLERQVIERTRSLEERTGDLERRRKELEALYRADEELLSRLDLDAVLQVLVDTAVEILGADKGGVLVWDFGKEELVIRASKAIAPETLQKMRFAPGQGVVGRVFETGEPIAVEDTSRDDRVTKEIVEPEGIRSFLQVPIKIGDEIYGVFSADYLQPRTFDQATEDLLISLAGHAALAIDNARLYQEQKRRAEQFKMLNAVGSHVTSIMAIDELLCELVKLIRESFGYYLVEIGLIEGEELAFRAGAGGTWGADFEDFRLKVGGEGITALVAETGEPLIVRDTREEPRYVRITATDTLSELAVPIKTKEKIIGVINIESDECCAFDESDLAVFQSLADQAAIAIENARLYEAEQRRAEQFHALLHTGSHITSILSVDELRAQISQLVKEALGYFQVSIGLIEGEAVVYRSGAGPFWERLEREPLRIGFDEPSLSGQVARSGEPLMVPNVLEEPSYFFLPGDTETRSELVVPLKIKDRVIGALAVSSDQMDDFDQSDVAVLQSLADQAAVAIENARLYEQAQQLAVVEERARLARDLHDAVTQTLFSASLIAEALPGIWREDQAEGLDLLRELRQLNRGALAEMRTLLMELRPSALLEASFGDLMRQLADSVSGRIGHPVSATIDNCCELPGEVHIALYRIAQEALNNVVKHAGAVEVQISYCSSEATQHRGVLAELRIRDDGVGFDPAGIPQDRMGLRILRERAESVGASLEIQSQPGSGTEITVVWEGTTE